MEISGIRGIHTTTTHYVASKNQSIISDIARDTLLTNQGVNNAHSCAHLLDKVTQPLSNNFEKYKNLQKFIKRSLGEASDPGNYKDPFISSKASLSEAHHAVFSRLLV